MASGAEVMLLGGSHGTLGASWLHFWLALCPLNEGPLLQKYLSTNQSLVMNKERKGRRKAKQGLSHSESFMEGDSLCGLKISYETVLLEGHGNDFLPGETFAKLLPQS